MSIKKSYNSIDATVAKAMALLAGLVLASATTACDTSDTSDSLEQELRPESGTVLLDLTREDHAMWFLDHAKPFHLLDNDRADELIHVEWAGERGVCVAASKSNTGLGPDVFGPYFENPENYYESGETIPAREDTAATAGVCDVCGGLTVPYFTPRSMKLTMSSVNITPAIDDRGTPPPAEEDNLNEIFVDAPEVRSDLARANPSNRGFLGVITRIPAREDDNSVIADTDSSSGYEFLYIRPANGDTTPGEFFGGTPNTTVQFGARFYEWFVLRTRAFGESLGEPVFEGPAKTNFGDTNVATMTSEANVLELSFDSRDTQPVSVNGEPVVSNVTKKAFDRTILGSVEPSTEAKTMSALFVGGGVYGCFQRIELEL